MFFTCGLEKDLEPNYLLQHPKDSVMDALFPQSTSDGVAEPHRLKLSEFSLMTAFALFALISPFVSFCGLGLLFNLFALTRLLKLGLNVTESCRQLQKHADPTEGMLTELLPLRDPPEPTGGVHPASGRGRAEMHACCPTGGDRLCAGSAQGHAPGTSVAPSSTSTSAELPDSAPSLLLVSEKVPGGLLSRYQVWDPGG